VSAVADRLHGGLARVRAVERPLLLLSAMALVVQIGVAVMLPLLPLYAQSLGATPTTLGLLTSAFAVTNAFGQLATGFLAERYAVRRLVAGGMGAYAVANMLIATAGSAASLVAFRALAGVGGGMMLVGQRLYLVQITDRTRLAFANGVLSAAGSAGMVVGPAFGGLLAAVDLRAPFILVGVTSLLAAIGSFFLPKPAARPADDGAGSASVEHGAADQQRRGSVRSWLLILLVSQVAFLTSFGAFITTYAPFTSSRLGWGTAEIGLVFGVFGLGSVTLGPLIARQADLRGRRNTAILASIPVALFGLVYLWEAPRLALYAVSILAGAGVTAGQASWFALLAEATEGGRRGRRFGAVAAISNLGIVVGATVAAAIWERTGDVGVGMIMAAGSIGVSMALLALHPADPPAVATSQPTPG
jgi:MFS transporter, DHA1 family, multidrug resistance protein